MTNSQTGLLAIAVLIPALGFIMTLTHARKAETRTEQRWRKRHGLLFWVLIPFIAGAVSAAAILEMIPPIFTIIGVAILGLATFLSWSFQTRHDEKMSSAGQ